MASLSFVLLLAELVNGPRLKPFKGGELNLPTYTILVWFENGRFNDFRRESCFTLFGRVHKQNGASDMSEGVWGWLLFYLSDFYGGQRQAI